MDGFLPLCDSDNREQLENLIFEHQDFARISGKWVFLPMAQNQDVADFMKRGKELQAMLDGGEYTNAANPKQKAGWLAMTEKFDGNPWG